MRRLLVLLLPGLLLALTACGGNTTSSGVTPTVEARVLAEVSGKLAADQPAPGQPAPLVSQPENPAEGLAITDISTTVGGNGKVVVVGKVGNTGQQAARTTSIAVEVVDANGQRISRQQFAYPRLPVIYPGDQVAWEGQTQFTLGEGQRVQVAIAGEPVNAQ